MSVDDWLNLLTPNHKVLFIEFFRNFQLKFDEGNRCRTKE